MQADTGRMGRGIRWALGLSLAVNLLLIGALAGAGYRHAGGPGVQRGGGAGAAGYAAPYMQALPRAERHAMREQMREHMRGHDRPTRADRLVQYQQMLAALRSEPFDVAQVRAVLEAQRDTGAAVHAAAQDVWLDRIGQMDAAARAAYADQLEAVLQRGPRKGKHRNRD